MINIKCSAAVATHRAHLEFNLKSYTYTDGGYHTHLLWTQMVYVYGPHTVTHRYYYNLQVERNYKCSLRGTVNIKWLKLKLGSQPTKHTIILFCPKLFCFFQ